MSVPKDKLHNLIEKLNDNDAEKIIDIAEAFILKREAQKKTQEKIKEKKFDFERYKGILKRFNINPDEMAKELRGQWKRNIS
ncbi:MAG: hypothetical protein A2Y25_02920 [Candidatus Melainabacteria bacterium GWF2_37_15]|nr:MAG: hypothetical protein A2Y25_02920 [Candidatus Melainabacteria bacterium GWF2_37_15]